MCKLNCLEYDKQGAVACKANLHHPCICKNTPLHALHCRGEDHPCVCSQGSHHALYCKANNHDCICVPGRFKKALHCKSH